MPLLENPKPESPAYHSQAACLNNLRTVSEQARPARMALSALVHGAEAQQYRDRIRKAKLHVYEMYLWRKDMMQDYQEQVQYMRSLEWDEIYSEKIRRWALGHGQAQLGGTGTLSSHLA